MALPDPQRAIQALKERRGSAEDNQPGAHWAFSAAISPLDLYLYLKWRFGPPNGFAMALRSDSIDNLIHWNYTLQCTDSVFEIVSMNTRTEVHAYRTALQPSEWIALETCLAREFSKNRKALAKAQKDLEQWHLFVNPYRRLALIVEGYSRRLADIKVPVVSSPPSPARPEDMKLFEADMGAAMTVYREALSLCVSLEMICPVMGEAAVNFFLLLLAKADIKKDQRLREDIGRRPIDVRVKTLHILCDGFERGITGGEDPFKNFHRLMNRRNDALHGNIDPRKQVGEALFFDFVNIPLYRNHRSLAEVAMHCALADLSTERALEDVRVVRSLVDFLVSCLRPEIRDSVIHAMSQPYLGFRPTTGRIGIILPSIYVDFVVGGEEA